MMEFKRGSTSNIVRFKLQNDTTGAGKTGLAFNTSGLIISTIADNEASATAYTVAGSTIETITTLGTFATPTATKCRFKEVDATNHPGVYEFQFADARFAVSNAKSLLVSVSGASGLFQADYNIPLVAFDPQDTVRLGLTALPNAAVSGVGGLLTAPTTANVGLADLSRILGTALTETAGQIAGAFKQFFDVASPTGTMKAITAVGTLTTYTGNTPQTGDSYARLGAPAGASISADVAAIKSDTGTILTDVNTGAGAIYTRLGAPAGASIAADIAAVESNALAIKAKTDNLPASPSAVSDIPTANQNADALLDRAAGVETGRTFRQAMRIMLAALAGKASGLATTTATYRDTNDSKDRIVATVDADGDRTAVTLDAS